METKATEDKTGAVSPKVARLIKWIDREIKRRDFDIKDGLEALSQDFVYAFDRRAEMVYKWSLQLAYLRRVASELEPDMAETKVRVRLRQLLQRLRDDMLATPPYFDSRQAAERLSYRWSLEALKAKENLTMCMLQWLDDDDNE